MAEIILLVEPDLEGGFVASVLRHAIVAQAPSGDSGVAAPYKPNTKDRSAEWHG